MNEEDKKALWYLLGEKTAYRVLPDHIRAWTSYLYHNGTYPDLREANKEAVARIRELVEAVLDTADKR